VRGRLIAGRYRLDEPLGAGGMSAVWAAEDTELGRPVAIKLLARDADHVRFEREAQAAAALAHANVVRVFDFGENEDGPYMVLELLTGGSLEDRLEPGRPLPDAETERIARGLAAGLAHAHAAGLVHRDLKPANVLFDADDRPKISDFGIARIEGSGTLTETGTVIGTALTISPEQASGETATPASDVYSFGVILYRMLAGRFPFESENPMALLAMHVQQPPTPLAELRPDVPSRLESVATAALAKDPAQRPPDGAALVRELGEETAVTRVLSAALPSRRGLPLRLSVLAGIAAAVAAAGVGLALLVTRSTDERPPAAPVKTTTSPPATTEEPETEAPPPTTRETATETTAPATTEPEPTTTMATDTALPTTGTLPTTTEVLPPTTTETVP
jgi:serine/threonine protein kinase